VPRARGLREGAGGAAPTAAGGATPPPRRTREFEEVNVDGARRLLAAARAAGVRRVVAVSSNSPFGFNRDPADTFDESSPYQPYQGYGRSKAALERLVLELGAADAFETVIIRPPWFYGPPHPPPHTPSFT